MATLQSRLGSLITQLGTDYKAIMAAFAAVPINTQTGTTYTLVLADAGKNVELNNASAITLTVPPNSSVAFPVGTVIQMTQMGAGQVTFAPGAGVTIRSRGAVTKINAQYGVAAMYKRATDEWVLTGDLTT
jgi:hypothetical protein